MLSDPRTLPEVGLKDRQTDVDDNDKGGVTKTTTAVHKAFFKKALGLNGVLIDNDNNRGLTNWLLGESFDPHRKGVRNILDVFTDSEALLMGALVEIDPDGTITQRIREIMPDPYRQYKPGRLFLVPGARSLYLAAKRFKPTPHVASITGVLSYILRHPALAQCHEGLGGRVDFVEIDNAPGFDDITLAGLLAADKVISPIEAASLSLNGLNDYIWRLDQANEQRRDAGVPGRTELDGVLIGRLNTHLQSQVELAKRIPAALEAGDIYCYHAQIPETDGVFTAPSYRGPVWAHAPQDAGSVAFMDFCIEAAERLVIPHLRIVG